MILSPALTISWGPFHRSAIFRPQHSHWKSNGPMWTRFRNGFQKIRRAAAESEIVATSSQEALAAALPDVEEINRTVETARDDLVRAAAIEQRAQIVSLQVLDYRNFVSAVIQPMASVGGGLRRLRSGVSKVAEMSAKEAADAVPRGDWEGRGGGCPGADQRWRCDVDLFDAWSSRRSCCVGRKFAAIGAEDRRNQESA